MLISGLICLLIGISVGMLMRHYVRKAVEHSPEQTDIVDRYSYMDTTRTVVPKARDSVAVRHETARLPLAHSIPVEPTSERSNVYPSDEAAGSDSCMFLVRHEEPPDSADVVVPITQQVYTDSTYRAWVSGYHARLDSIEVYSRREIVNRSMRIKRWHIGPAIGVGASRRGVDVFVGVCLTYSIFSF